MFIIYINILKDFEIDHNKNVLIAVINNNYTINMLMKVSKVYSL